MDGDDVRAYERATSFKRIAPLKMMGEMKGLTSTLNP